MTHHSDRSGQSASASYRRSCGEPRRSLDATDFARDGEPGRRFFDQETSERAKALYDSIDLTKAWNDPANQKAARTVLPVFLVPGGGAFRDKHGYAVSHFAFVRGADGKDNGGFHETVGITLFGGEKTISDGTVHTLALGQANDDLSPWIAAGYSTARHVYADGAFTAPTFWSQYDGGCYFANCDSSAYFLDVHKTPAAAFRALATRAGGEVVGSIAQYRTAAEWKLER